MGVDFILQFQKCTTTQEEFQVKQTTVKYPTKRFLCCDLHNRNLENSGVSSRVIPGKKTLEPLPSKSQEGTSL